MHRQIPLPKQIYDLLYPTTVPTPKPDPALPPNFESLAKLYLSKEAKSEARHYYGEDGGLLLRLAGLDYSLPHVQRRLSRYRHHAHLFQAFNKLGLTKHEIYTLCTWDCTLWQKHRYLERHPEQVLALKDTTGADIPTWEEVERQREQAREREKAREMEKSRRRFDGMGAVDLIVGKIAEYLDVDETSLTPTQTDVGGVRLREIMAQHGQDVAEQVVWSHDRGDSHIPNDPEQSSDGEEDGEEGGQIIEEDNVTGDECRPEEMETPLSAEVQQSTAYQRARYEAYRAGLHDPTSRTPHEDFDVLDTNGVPIPTPQQSMLPPLVPGFSTATNWPEPQLIAEAQADLHTRLVATQVTARGLSSTARAPVRQGAPASDQATVRG